jgi:hypothetical protein
MLALIDEFLGLNHAQLSARLTGGHPIDPPSLDDTEYLGISLGLPAFVDKLAWKTFKKTFHRDPKSGKLRGWNIRMEQTGFSPPYQAKQQNGVPVTWGHYAVVSGENYRGPKPVPQGLMLDYGLGGNVPWDLGVTILRDPLVALEPGSSTVLLGWSYLRVGPVQVPTPSYFLLLRDCPLTHVAHAPRIPNT